MIEKRFEGEAQGFPKFRILCVSYKGRIFTGILGSCHPKMKLAAQVILADGGIEGISDPRLLAPLLYLKLDPLATSGFQVLMMIYKDLEPNNELPADICKDQQAFLDAINQIVDLQNKDPKYKY